MLAILFLGGVGVLQVIAVEHHASGIYRDLLLSILKLRGVLQVVAVDPSMWDHANYIKLMNVGPCNLYRQWRIEEHMQEAKMEIFWCYI